MRWQMSLYKERSGNTEDAEDPEKVVKRVQEVSAVLYHIEVVSTAGGGASLHQNQSKPARSKVILLSFRPSIPTSPKRWFGTSCCPSSAAGQWWPASGWRLSTTSPRNDPPFTTQTDPRGSFEEPVLLSAGIEPSTCSWTPTNATGWRTRVTRLRTRWSTTCQ